MMRKFFTVFALAIALFAFQSASRAQSITWVSVNGSDALPLCTYSHPCLSFPEAIMVAGAGGEVDCLTPGFYGGPVTITVPITINCPGGVVDGGISINAGSGAVVVLRGIQVQGLAGAFGVDGLAVTSISGALVLDSVRVSGFTMGNGLSITCTQCEFSVTNSQFIHNQGGIAITPPAAGNAYVSLSHVDIENNSTSGILLAGIGESQVNLIDSVVANNTGDGIQVSGSGSKRQFLTIQHTSSVFNGANGLNAAGAQAFVLIGESTVAWNQTGVTSSGGGLVFSYRNNQINGNVTDISGGLPQAPLQ